nr:receptor-like protein 7 [Ziziphus jujuba var. spinosa]
MVLEIVVANPFTVQPAYHDDESFALMQFKDSLAIHKSVSLCHLKVLQWKSHGVNTSNCCSWDGVQCDGKTGHVIGLDLSSSYLFGSINSNSTLFNLVHLQSLNLAGEFPAAIFQLPNLRNLDVGSNGNLKLECYEVIDPDPFTYLSMGLSYLVSKAYLFQVENRYAITLTSKGVKRYYRAIQDILAFIDMSSNKYERKIYELFGNLKALHSMNLSNNMLTGCIPSSLGNLTALESLDLSQNNLSGNQFNAFESSSFKGNPGLCDDLLFKKCGGFVSSSPSPLVFQENDDSESSIKFDWKFVVTRFISGLAVGVVLSDIMIVRRHGCLKLNQGGF